MKIRRYLGFDCDSVNGFNNGGYIDEHMIEVKDIPAAMQACRDALGERYVLPAKDSEQAGLETLDNGYQLITGYFDDNGNEVTESEFQSLNENTEVGMYSYVYITFEECEV